MSKKLTSTILLFTVFIGFLWWGLAMLTSSLSATVKDGESIVYSLMILGCSLAALVAILKLPRKEPTSTPATTPTELAPLHPSSCPECSNKTHPGEIFCGSCGASLEKTMISEQNQ